MKRMALLLVICMVVLSVRIQRLNLHQLRRDAIESFNLLRSAEVALDIPLTGNMTWEDLLGN